MLKHASPRYFSERQRTLLRFLSMVVLAIGSIFVYFTNSDVWEAQWRWGMVLFYICVSFFIFSGVFSVAYYRPSSWEWRLGFCIFLVIATIIAWYEGGFALWVAPLFMTEVAFILLMFAHKPG